MSDKMRKGDLPLPEPRSPEALDEKIIAYARENAPESSRRSAPWGWAGGFAAACIATVAVIIAVPEQATDDALYRESATTAASAKKQDEAPARLRAEAEAESAAAAAEIMAEEAPAARTMSKAKPEAGLELMQRSNESAPDAEFDELRVLGDAPMAAALAPESPETVLQALKLYWDAGDEAKARAEWDRYRSEAGDPALPERIEDAFAKYLKKP